jgi:hypothetical protein
LSLLNTPWYIKQWRDKRPKQTKFINLNDLQIDKLTSTLQQWETRTVQVPVYNDPQNEKGYIEWEIKPTYAGQALRVQDMMIMRIIDDASWRIPIYFAVTVSQQNRIGLDQYLDMQGLTFQLKSHKTKPVDTEKMYENLMTGIGPESWSTNFPHNEFYEHGDESNQRDSNQNDNYINWSKGYQPGYMFRNLGNENIYYNKQTKRLLQNYRGAYMQLAVTYYMEYQRKDRKKKDNLEPELKDLKSKITQVLDRMEENIPAHIIPIQSEDLHYQVARIYGDLEEKEAMRNILENLANRPNGRPLNRVEYANTFFKELDDTEKAIAILENMRADYLRKESMLKTLGFSKKTVKKGEWGRWQKAYPEIISSLVYIYRESNQLFEAESILSEWVSRNPSDGNAKKILEEVRSGG